MPPEAQTKHRLYEKDLGFSYKPYLPILGSGLVTANGMLWQKQRVLIGPALRLDILVPPRPPPLLTLPLSSTPRHSRLPVHHTAGSSNKQPRQSSLHIFTSAERALSNDENVCSHLWPGTVCKHSARLPRGRRTMWCALRRWRSTG